MQAIISGVILCTLLLVSGCASITMGTKQSVQVEVSNCSKPTRCTAANKKGSWYFTAPGSVSVEKSDRALTIRCKDGKEFITRKVTPNKDSMVWGNVIFGGVIGGGWDGHTDAHWEYPETVTLVRNTCDSSNTAKLISRY